MAFGREEDAIAGLLGEQESERDIDILLREL
jgi:hypothetical protein